MSASVDPEEPVTPSPNPNAANPDLDVKSERVPYFWMVKPCFVYKDEYKDCKSFKDRFHQHYVHGEFRDCAQWKVDHENCLKWEKNNDREALERVIVSEKQRVQQRLKAHYANDVWEHREYPPENWSQELPEDVLRSYDDSFLKTKAEELRSGQDVVIDPEYVFSDLKCSIM